jgi:hypothetical protein
MGRKSDSVRTTRRRLHVASQHPRLHDLLARLVSILDDAAEQAGWGAPPSLVAIMSWPDDDAAGDEGDVSFDFGMKPLDGGTSVVDALACFDAPAEWAAIGVVTEGNARHLVDPTVERRRVRCVHLVERNGASASSVRLQGDDPMVLRDGGHPEGRIDDVCRRALGLPTAPPATSSLQLWALVWLERIMEWIACCGADVTWTDVATLHPAAAVLVGDDEARWEREAAANVVRLGSIMADVQSWPVLRAACAAGDWPVDDIPPAVAAWLDDGAFSRWLLGSFPPFDQFAGAVADALPPSLRTRFRAVLREWQLPMPS